jgi:hypothetical protein
MLTALLSFALLALGNGQSNSCDPGYVWDGRECIADTCSSSTPYKYGNSCFDSCPSGTFSYFYECMTTCPSGTYEYSGNCVGGCPARTYNGRCVDSCPQGTYDYNNGCVDACPSDTVSDGNRCYENCPSGSYRYNGGCVFSCPSEASYIYRGGCRDECWRSGLYYQSPGSKECVYSCPNFYEWKTNTCIDQCAPEQKKSGTGCYETCPSAIPYADGDTCVLNCPRYIDMATNNCVDVCPSGTNIYGNRCEKETPTPPTCNSNQYFSSDNTCRDIPTCASNQYLGSDYTCYDNTVNCNSNQYLDASNTCRDIPTCNPNQYLGSDYTCYNIQNNCQYSYAGTCVNACPSGTFNQYGKCVERCDDYMFRNGTDCVYQCDKARYNGDCFDSCPREAPWNFYGKCLAKCPEGMWEKDGQCTYECPHFWLNMTCVERCPPSTFIVNEKYCYDDCPIGFKRDGQHCDMTNYTYPCSYTQQLSADGRCVDYTYNYTNPCGADQWMLNNTCVPACKEGEFMDMNGNCMNPADMCQRGLPGGVYNYDTNTCECPEGHWIQRDDTFVPPVACRRVTTTPYPRINCPSFIPYTIYKPELDNCVCDADHPVIIPNPKDTFLSFSCAALGTETTIRPCDGGLYFDFMEGKCITVTVKPTYTPTYTPMPSACPAGTVMMDGKCQREIINVTPSPSMCPRGTVMVEGGCKELASQTSMPSRKPSVSSTPSRSVKPSNRPNSVTSTPSASRTSKPSNRVYADVSRKPLPSIDLQPPPANVLRSPAPSAWPKKVIVDIPPEEKPAYIEAKVKLPGGNITEMAKPEKIQDMQASLACTLRMPLENIRITSITYVDEKGNAQKLDVDPTKFMMMGDGDIGCYSRNKTATARRLRVERVLQTKGSIDIDYSIIQPSDDILSMDTTQMNDVIGNSPIMLEIATSVGSASVENSAVEAAYNAAPSTNPGQSEGAGSTFAQFQGMVGGGIAGFLVFAGLLMAVTFYYKENKRKKRLLKEQKDKPVVVQQPKQIILQFNGEQIQNPMSVIQTAVHHADSTRFDYGPLKATHKSLV